jgi:hypothetical protein
MIYKIADFNFEINTNLNYVKNSLKDFECDSESIDYSAEISQSDIMYEVENSEYGHKRSYLEFIAILRKFGEWLPQKNAFVLHSALFDVDETGVAFAAHSGVGKTTHMMRWKEYLKDRMTIVNGDKPIIRFFDEEPNTPYAYGTPWMGKERFGCNMRSPLKHICFIERAENNYVEKIDKKEAINRIFNQVYMPKAPMAVVSTLQLIDRLLSSCKLWVIHCNMDENAGEIAYKSIFEAENG